jgi:hypothetical protein
LPFGATSYRRAFTTAKSRGLQLPLPYAPIGLPTGVGLLSYCPARAATSSRLKAGMSATTRPQTEWRVAERRICTSSKGLLGQLPAYPEGEPVGDGEPEQVPD